MTAATTPATTEAASLRPAHSGERHGGVAGRGEELKRRRLLSSARGRILAAYVVLLTLSMVASLVLLRQILLTRLDEEINTQFTQEVSEFRRLAGGTDPETGERFGSDIKSIFDVYFSRNVPDEGEALFAFLGDRPYKSRRSGHAIYPLHRLDTAVDRWTGLRRPSLGALDTPIGSARYLAVPVKSPDGRTLGTFVVANFPAHEQDEIIDALRVAGQVTVVILLVASAVAWLLSGRVLAPLRMLTETARGISDSDLTRRISVRGRDEVAEMAATFNDMLDRLEEAFASQREFVNDAGHELRTPITVIRGHLELLDGDSPEERRETLALVMDELDRMNRIVGDLLVLAKAQQPHFLDLQSVDVATLTEELYSKAVTLGDRDWQLEDIGQGSVVADRQRLTQAVMQLAQNATEHTVDGTFIGLGSAMSNGEVRLWVRDRGEGIPIEDQERIFERFSRGEGRRRRSEGAGLGLAIVKAIAEAHGGRVELHSRPGGGATFTLVVPARGRRRAEEGAGS